MAEKLQQKLMFLANEYKQLQNSYKVKEEDYFKLTEKNKILKNKLEEYYKNNATSNFSNIAEIKLHYDKETLIMKELNKSYKEGLDEKREDIMALNEEINSLRSKLNEERINYLEHIKEITKIREREQLYLFTRDSKSKASSRVFKRE